MADANNTPVPSKSKIMRILNGAAGLKDLTPNQRMLKLADMSKVNVKNLLRLGGIKGAALMAAADLAIRMLPEAKEQGKGADPLNLFGPKKKKNRVDKKAVEAAVKEAIDSDTATKTSITPKTRNESSTVIESKRPKIRKKEKDMMAGGMAKAKPRTGNMDYRMGGMFMKNGKK